MAKFLELDYSDLSHIGRRPNNEDYAAFYVPEKEEDKLKSGSLFIVADGVGGAAKGEVASKYAAERVIYEYYSDQELPSKDRLKRAFQKANREIHDYVELNGHFTKMATTMVAAVVIQNQLIVANVGDSRAYLIRGEQIRQISCDHSYVAEMVRNGSMTEEEARTSKAKNRLSRSIGGEASVRVDVYSPVPLQMGDKILLCSDGLTRYATDAALLQLSANGKPEEITKKMVKFVNHHGGADNTSVIFLETVAKSRTKKKTSTQGEGEPVPPEWQTAATEHQQLIKRRKQPAWIYGVVFILLSTIAFLALGPNDLLVNIKIGNLINSSTGNQITEVPTNIETQTPNPKPAETPTVLLESSETENLDEKPSGGVIGQEPTPTETTDPSKDSAGVVVPGKEWECVYEIKDTDNLGLTSILNKFPEQYKVIEGKNFEQYDNCSIDNIDKKSYSECLGREPIENVHEIYSGNYLIVFSSTDENEQKICIDRSSKIFYPQNQGGS